MWPDQWRVLGMMVSLRLLIVLKARQLGISWLACAYALWLCVFHPNRLVIIISKGSLEAKEMVRRISVLYKRLPEWLKERLPTLQADNSADLEWSNGSKVQALAATPDAGSSLTASLLILDEFAKMIHAKQIYTAAKPTIDGGGKLFIISTAKGRGNPFHSLWLKMKQGQNKFVGLFLPWWSRPDRSDEWYEDQVREADDPATVQQEYPRTPEEAFLSSGRSRFLDSWLTWQRENCVREPLLSASQNPEDLPDVLLGIQGLGIYVLPEATQNYLITVDPAEGLPHSDPSVATVWCCETWEEVAVVSGKIDPSVMAHSCSVLGSFYNDAFIYPLRKNHGHAFIAELVSLSYPYIARGPDGRHGLDENVKTKPMMVDDTAKALRDQLIFIHSEETVAELEIYEVKENGATGAPEGCHEDHAVTVFAFVAHMTQAQPAMHSSLTGTYAGAEQSKLATAAAGLGVRSSRLAVGLRASAPSRLPRRFTHPLLRNHQ